MKIRPFKALRPDLDWFKNMIRDDQHPLIQSFLEPASGQALSLTKMEKNRESLEMFIANGSYTRLLQDAFYVYEQQHETGSVFGIWALTSLDDFQDGKVMPHENTLSEQSERIRLYRKVVGIEATPVVFTYYREAAICKIIEEVTLHRPDFEFDYAFCKHRLWTVRDADRIQRITTAFNSIDMVCIADGHHRLQAASSLHEKNCQWISSFYISSGQLRCKPFHRIITLKDKIDTAIVLSELGKTFKVTPLNDVVLFKPQQRGHIGLYLGGTWYQLERTDKTTVVYPDVTLLQEQVLAPLFGITIPSTDQRLQCWSNQKLDSMMGIISGKQDMIIFTLYPLGVDQLLQLAQQGSFLPPKSTFVEPKLPYGMLIYQNQTSPLCASLK